ncbi:MAG: hypothetical protein ACOYON_14140 [Fimbriimonas sp.]
MAWGRQVTKHLPVWTPAVLLAGLVFYIFAPLRYYGPENVVRRFHTAIRELDKPAVGHLSLQAVNDPSVDALATRVFEVLPVASPLMIGSERKTNEVWVAYDYRTSPPLIIVWVVKKDPKSGDWKVDCETTLRILEGLSRQKIRPRTR